jgi:hypothetical protein
MSFLDQVENYKQRVRNEREAARRLRAEERFGDLLNNVPFDLRDAVARYARPAMVKLLYSMSSWTAGFVIEFPGHEPIIAGKDAGYWRFALPSRRWFGRGHKYETRDTESRWLNFTDALLAAESG